MSAQTIDRLVTAEQVVDLEQIQALYSPERWDEPIPVLDMAAQMAVRECFDQKSVHMVAGSLVGPQTDLPSSPEWRNVSTIGRVLSRNGHSRALIDNYADAFAGPYFLKRQYYQTGVGVWVPNGPITPQYRATVSKK